MSPTLRSDRRADPHLRDADGGIVSRPPDLVMALIEELQVTHNFEVRFPSNNQHALDMLFALQHFYLAYADVDDAAREAPGVSAAGAVA